MFPPLPLGAFGTCSNKPLKPTTARFRKRNLEVVQLYLFYDLTMWKARRKRQAPAHSINAVEPWQLKGLVDLFGFKKHNFCV
jgi:hypothetical protein